MRVVRIWLSAAALIVMLGLGQLPAAAQDRSLVVAVNYPLSYFAERLVGDSADVLFPVPKGSDPAFWRPGVSDIVKIQSADVILLNGAGFATWTAKTTLPRSRLFDTSRGFQDQFIATDTVTHSHGAGGKHSHAGTASYTWLDQALAIRQAEAVADALKRRRVGDAGKIDERLVALTADLRTLDEAAEKLGSLAGDRMLIATHPRYQYFARAYGLKIRSLEWEAGEMPSKEQLADLAALAEQTGAQVLLWEDTPPEAARQSIRDMGLTGVVFPTLVSTPGEADYLSAFTTAVDNLTTALQTLSEG
jgi:zinc transport system substrate-binding protein